MLENVPYVPTLALRSSELKGLGYLPNHTKQRMMPCFLLAPWSRTPNLGRSIERIEQSFDVGHYMLDIDRDYIVTNQTNPSQIEWGALQDPQNGYENWCSFVLEHPKVIPCVQLFGQDTASIRQQIGRFQAAGRPFFIRESRSMPSGALANAVDAVNAIGSADFAVVLEGGWARDVLQLSVWFTGLIRGQLQSIEPSVPIVSSSTSMPKTFTQYQGGDQVNFSNRQLLRSVQAATNRDRVIFGDWASTRPREASGGGGHFIPPRIDYPKDEAWWIYRDGVVPWTFQQAASALVRNEGVWDGDTQTWGEQQIALTAVNESSGIDTLQKNVTARVNIHLHRQSYFGSDSPSPLDLEDDWSDID